MKTVLVTQRLQCIEDYGEIRECIDIKWNAFLKECGVLPIYLSVNGDIDTYIEEFNPVGVILTGGNDLYSVSKEDKLCRMRDDFESLLIEKALAMNISIIGICRGMQIIAHYFGAKLEKINNHVASRHKLVVSSESRNEDILNKLSDVNSYHQYGLYNVPNEFIVSAKSKDDIIEAIEHRNKKIFAYMWHPEREQGFSQIDVELFKKGLNI